MNAKIQLLLVFCCILAANAQYGYGRGGFGRGGGGRFFGGRRGYNYGGNAYGYVPHFVHPEGPGIVAGQGQPGVVAGVDGKPGVVATAEGTVGTVAGEVATGAVDEFGREFGFVPGYGPGFNRGYGPGFNRGYGPGFNRGYGPGFNRGYGPGFNRGYGPGFNRGYGPGFNRGYGPGFNNGHGPVEGGVAGTGVTVAKAGGAGTVGAGGTVAKAPGDVAVGTNAAEAAAAIEDGVIGKLDARKLKRNEVVSGLTGSDTVPIKDIFLGGVDDRLVELLPGERYRE